MEVPRVPEFYKHQKILVTGGTGSIGKALIEKLLRSCPDLDTIYVIIRSKGSKTPRQRWEETTKMTMFRWLQSNCPVLLDKVIAVEGDVKQRRLGLSDEDYRRLQNEVTIVFHGAASVRFNDPLPDAVLMNTRGTLEMVHLALGMTNLKAFVHISTTYCNPLQSRTEERVYPSPADWREVIKIAENLDRRQVTILQQKYTKNYPNTYTFSKNLGESIIWEYREQIPIIIARPSIVTNAVSHPHPGYLDTYNGPVGVAIGVLYGFIRTLNVPPDGSCRQDYIPIDDCAKAIVLTAWYRSDQIKKNLPRREEKLDEVSVVNLSQPNTTFSTYETTRLAQMAALRAPFNVFQIFQYRVCVVDSKRLFKILAVLFHLLPAILLNFAIKFTKYRNVDILRIAEKVHVALIAINYFMKMNWVFPNTNLLRIVKSLNPEDRKKFEVTEMEYMNMLLFVEETGKGTTALSKATPSEKNRKKYLMRRWIENLLVIVLIYKLFPTTYNFISGQISSNFCTP